jgi:choline dehydrogenase-like flavoprotein
MSDDDNNKVWDAVIVGSGFAGALIAHHLGKNKKQVLILEAGAGVPTNINKYLQRFYTSSAKVPESPYTPELFDGNGKLVDPGTVNAGRPSVLTLGPASKDGKPAFGDWKDPHQAYLIQTGPRPFASNYDRVAGGTQHWLGTSLRFVPNDFKMKSTYDQFVDWPIGYDDLEPWYCKAEAELGVSADTKEQEIFGIKFSQKYPMQRIPDSTTDQAVDAALAKMTEDEIKFLEKDPSIDRIRTRSLPAARNSEPYRNRRACAGNTNCIPICPIQAKYDPTITLNDAMDTGFVKMMDRTVANEIIVGENGDVSEIKFIRHNSDIGQRKEPGSVKAKIFIIAANAIETPRLLLMSKNGGRTKDGVANGSRRVGKHLMDHPYYVAWGMSDRPLYPYRGPLITSGIGDLCDGAFRRQRGAFRVDIGNEGWNFVVGGDPNKTTLDFINGTNETQANEKSEALFGKALMQRLHDQFTHQFRIGFLIEQSPDDNNRVTLAEGQFDGLGLPRPQISYDISDYTRKGFVAAHRMKNLLFRRMDVKDFTRPGEGDPSAFDEMIDGTKVTMTYIGAGHIMGTCRMGRTSDDSVVNDMQRSWDHKNLYIVGSSTFPTGATANPTLTIAALSLRTADHIVRDVLR